MIDEIEKIGFIGAGNMASALISGLINNGIPPAGIMASSPEEDHLKNLTDNYGIKTTNKKIKANLQPIPRRTEGMPGYRHYSSLV